MSAAALSGFAADAVDLLAGTEVRIDDGIVLDPHRFVWFRVRAASCGAALAIAGYEMTGRTLVEESVRPES
jgi:hypothetical protein